jgi:CheY-like chemotaxis protein
MSNEAQPNVLIVEDDAGCVELIRDVLNELGLCAVSTDSVQGALQAARSQSFRMIILDVMLSDGDGLQVLDAVRLEPCTACIPVIVCTAALFELQARRDLSDDPLTALVVKPFHIAGFIRVVTGLLAG